MEVILYNNEAVVQLNDMETKVWEHQNNCIATFIYTK